MGRNVMAINLENRSVEYVVFHLDEQQYALKVSAVERVVHAVELTLLPEAPDIVLGIINIHGKIIPVVNISRRFHLPEKDIEPTNRLIIAHTLKRTVALVVDVVLGVIETPEDRVVKTNTVLPGMDYVQGVVKREDGMILIHDLNKFLSLEEEQTLDTAIMNNTKGVK
jgi:purine-binding chemotaxis protein CheW